MHRLNTPKELEIIYYYTTILGNTAAGKAAIGPTNTSNSKIITILTP